MNFDKCSVIQKEKKKKLILILFKYKLVRISGLILFKSSISFPRWLFLRTFVVFLVFSWGFRCILLIMGYFTATRGGLGFKGHLHLCVRAEYLCFNCQSKRALKSVLQVCTHLPALEPLLYAAPNSILEHVLCQFSKVSPFHSLPMFRWFPDLRSFSDVPRPPSGGAAPRQQSSPPVRHQRGAEEGAGDQSRSRFSSAGAHQQCKWLLLRRDDQVGLRGVTWPNWKQLERMGTEQETLVAGTTPPDTPASCWNAWRTKIWPENMLHKCLSSTLKVFNKIRRLFYRVFRLVAAVSWNTAVVWRGQRSGSIIERWPRK